MPAIPARRTAGIAANRSPVYKQKNRPVKAGSFAYTFLIKESFFHFLFIGPMHEKRAAQGKDALLLAGDFRDFDMLNMNVRLTFQLDDQLS